MTAERVFGTRTAAGQTSRGQSGNQGTGCLYKERSDMPDIMDKKRERTDRSRTTSVHREVAFVLSSREAEQVYLCGDFNQWSPRSLPMIRRGEEHSWEKRLVLAPGRYEYKFIVNGIWIHNPDAAENVPNVHGSLNSVAEVLP
jgi:1,4-alpha-glucan branching enzyme